MIRHFLESIRRVAGLAPTYGVRTMFISKQMLWAHVRSLKKASELDQMAAPLQAEGLPILCQDVPYIPAAD